MTPSFCPFIIIEAPIIGSPFSASVTVPIIIRFCREFFFSNLGCCPDSLEIKMISLLLITYFKFVPSKAIGRISCIVPVQLIFLVNESSISFALKKNV